MKLFQNIIASLLLMWICPEANGQKLKSDYLIRFKDSKKDLYGYKNQKGEVIIPLGKYIICFTDTFRTYAVVLRSGLGFVAIDRNEKIMYEVFPFDNGPDYTSEGLFRIIKANKIGFADAATGKIRITPQFACAFPFKNGLAKVSNNCETKAAGEHKTWLSNQWFYIDKKGKKVAKPKPSVN